LQCNEFNQQNDTIQVVDSKSAMPIGKVILRETSLWDLDIDEGTLRHL